MDDIVLIGVDGGASKVLVHQVEILRTPLRFAPCDPHVEVSYDTSDQFQSGFVPVPLKDQLEEHRAGEVHQQAGEVRQEAAILEGFCRAIGSLELSPAGKALVIGIGLPGLKTPDKRGISAMANGPRMPEFLDKLESMLREQGLTELQPVHALGSDADYCGLGEHWGANGSMRNIENAYYLGVGTGVADAMLLNGEIVAFDHAKAWIAKTWEMMYSEDLTYESMVSAQGIQKRYAEATDVSFEDLSRRKVFPWQIFERAVDGEPAATEVVAATSEALARLIRFRITTLASGAGDTRLVDRGRRLESEHPYRGMTFDRIVIGQRLGDIWHHPPFRPLFRSPVEERLAQLLSEGSLPASVLSDYVDASGGLRDDFIVHSELRNAPALGAAVDAYFNWSQ